MGAPPIIFFGEIGRLKIKKIWAIMGTPPIIFFWRKWAKMLLKINYGLTPSLWAPRPYFFFGFYGRPRFFFVCFLRRIHVIGGRTQITMSNEMRVTIMGEAPLE